MMNYVACYSESIIKGIVLVIAGIFPFKIVQRKSSPLVRNWGGVRACGVCMLLITAAEREEVSEVQEVVAWRSAVATAPLCR